MKKKINTPFGEITNTTDSKKDIFAEQCRTDDQKEKNAQRALHARLSEDDREKAYRWTAFYNALVNTEEE